MENQQKPQNNQRIRYAFAGSFITLGIGIYCLFLEMAFPNFLYVILGGAMLYGTLKMKTTEKEQTGGILVLLSIISMLLLFNEMIYAILGDQIFKIGSGPNDYLTFSIIERFIIIICMLFGASCALIAGFDAIMKQDGFLKLISDFKLPYLTYLISSILTIMALGWVSLYLYLTRTFIDSLLFFPIFIGLLVFYFWGWWQLLSKDHIGMVLIMDVIYAIIFGFLSLLNGFYFIVALMNMLSLAALLTITKKQRSEKKIPLKQKLIRVTGVLVLVGVLGSIMAFTYIYPWEDSAVPIEAPDNSKDIIEVNWAYGSEMSKDWDWLARPEIVEMIKTINGNQSVWGINISVTVPLVRECFNATLAPDIAKILDALYKNNIVIDLMPIVDSSVLGDHDEYIHDENIDDFEVVYDEMKEFLAKYNLSNSYRALVIDLERTTTIKINDQVLSWMSGQNKHIIGQDKLIKFMSKLKANNELVAGAFFSFHIYDFVDFDDAQQDFFGISIVPPTDWEFIATMIYQYGRGSNFSVYSYCQDINYHFGDKGVPYAVTMHSSYDDILTRMRIMKNAGFQKIGMWAMHELFANGTNFGMSGHKNATPNEDSKGKEIPDPWTPEMFVQLHKDLAKDEPVSFVFDGYQSENTYETMILLVDIWLYRRPVYMTYQWPIMGQWLPNTFFVKTIVVIIGFIVIGVVTGLLGWYVKKRRTKTGYSDPPNS